MRTLKHWSWLAVRLLVLLSSSLAAQPRSDVTDHKLIIGDSVYYVNPKIFGAYNPVLLDTDLLNKYSKLTNNYNQIDRINKIRDSFNYSYIAIDKKIYLSELSLKSGLPSDIASMLQKYLKSEYSNSLLKSKPTLASWVNVNICELYGPVIYTLFTMPGPLIDFKPPPIFFTTNLNKIYIKNGIIIYYFDGDLAKNIKVTNYTESRSNNEIFKQSIIKLFESLDMNHASFDCTVEENGSISEIETRSPYDKKIWPYITPTIRTLTLPYISTEDCVIINKYQVMITYDPENHEKPGGPKKITFHAWARVNACVDPVLGQVQDFVSTFNFLMIRR